MTVIGINAHLLAGTAGYRQAGIHLYIKEILNHLTHDGQLDYTVFTGPNSAEYVNPQLQVKSSRWPTEKPPVRIAWEQLVWPLAARRAKVDLLHSMAFVTPIATSVPKIVTVYDLSFMHYPDRFTRFKRLYLQTQTQRSCRSAQRVVTISESGREDVNQLFGIPWEKIDVVEPGVDGMFRVLSAEKVAQFKVKNQITRPFILHVGTLQPRKNITTLIEAYAQLPNRSHDLVLVGGKGWLYDEIFARVEQLGIRDYVRFTGYAPDTDLPLWYNAADLFVFPSVYEGFGMPVAQAMACGTPVIASHASSIPEVVGQAGQLFDPHDVAGLTACMENILNDPAQRQTLRDRGFLQAKRFSWTQSGAKMMSSYKRVFNKEA